MTIAIEHIPADGFPEDKYHLPLLAAAGNSSSLSRRKCRDRGRGFEKFSALHKNRFTGKSSTAGDTHHYTARFAHIVRKSTKLGWTQCCSMRNQISGRSESTFTLPSWGSQRKID